MDCDYDREADKQKGGKKKNKLTEALMKDKPVFDPSKLGDYL
jgi:hypothetical protein